MSSRRHSKRKLTTERLKIRRICSTRAFSIRIDTFPISPSGNVLQTLIVSPVLQVFATQKACATSRIYQVLKTYSCSLVLDSANIRSRYRTSRVRKICSNISTTAVHARNGKIEPFNFYAIVSTRSALSSMLKEEVVCFRADNVPGIVIRSTGSKEVRICAKLLHILYLRRPKVSLTPFSLLWMQLECCSYLSAI